MRPESKIKPWSEETAARQVQRRHSRIPVDTVIWALLFAVALPLAIRAGWFRPVVRLHGRGEEMLLWLSLGFGCVGTLILALVRYPLYVRRHHQGFRPRELPHNYRPTFWISYVLIAVGLLILMTLITMQHLGHFAVTTT